MSNFLNFNGNQGMSFKTFTASGTTYTLDKSASTNSVLVSVGGVMQQPGVDYTVSGTTLTSTSAWTSGVQVDTYIIHKPGTAPTIQDNSIDSDHYVDGSIDLAHMSSQSVDEDNLHISNSGSNGQFLSKQSGDAGGLTWAAVGGITLGTLTATTGDNIKNITGIPSGTKRITLMFNGVSNAAGDSFTIQIGDAGGLETASYVAGAGRIVSNTSASSSRTDGFYDNNNSASITKCGAATLTLMDADTFLWVCTWVMGDQSSGAWLSGGAKTLSAELDRISVKMSGGSDTFDAGSINIAYE